MSVRTRSGLCLAVLISFAALAAAQNVYVAGGGSHTSPYDTWPKAATSLNIAVEYANALDNNAVVLVSNGTYVLTNEAEVSNVQVRGWGGDRDAVIVDGGNYEGRAITNRCFSLNHSNALLAGLTITNGWGANNFGGGVRLNADGATISNCVIANNRADRGAGIYANDAAGIVLNCLIATNRLTANHYGAGIYMLMATAGKTGLVDNCLFIGNRYGFAGGINGGQGGGGYFRYNVVVTNCLFEENLAYNGAGLLLERNVLVTDCIIRNNTSASTLAGGIRMFSNQSGVTTVSNCLITGNIGATAIGFGGTWTPMFNMYHSRLIGNTGAAMLCTTNNYLYNCLIASNGAGGLILGAINCYIESCTIAGNTGGQGAGLLAEVTNVPNAVLNTVIAGNVNTNDPGTDDDIYAPAAGASNMFAYCCAPDYGDFPPGAGNQQADPLLINAAEGDYRLGSGSPAIDSGLNQSWMDGALDLDGMPRIFHGQVDMGAYEYRFTGSIFSVR